MAKELLGTAANFYLVPTREGDPESFCPMIEVVVVVSEPNFTADAAGQLVRHRGAETLRFHTTSEGLRNTAAKFLELADIADKMITPGADRPHPNEDE